MKNPMFLLSYKKLLYLKRIATALLVFVLAAGVIDLGRVLTPPVSIAVSSVGDAASANGMAGENFGPEDLIRFHILANSDSPQDQELKYAVRDAVVTLMGARLAPLNNIEQARQELRDSEDIIVDCAKDVIDQRGYSYPVVLTWEMREFPTRAYGGVTLPAGEYEAVRILIGEAAGANWWCVLFPPLCFVQETAPVLSANTNIENNVLDEENVSVQTQEPEKASDAEQKENDYQPEQYQKRFFFMDFVKNLFGENP